MTAQEAIERLLDGADLLHVGGAAYLLAPVSGNHAVTLTPPPSGGVMCQ